MLQLIETDRIIGTKVVPKDFAHLHRLSNDPKVGKTMGGGRTEAQTHDRLQIWIDHWKEHGYGIWLLREKATGQLLGRAGLHTYVIDEKEEIELLYALMPEYWNQGLATEICKKILELAQDPLKLENLVCFTLHENVVSRHLMEKLGFIYEKEISHVGLPHVLYRLYRDVL